jgi:hypothetical protein
MGAHDDQVDAASGARRTRSCVEFFSPVDCHAYGRRTLASFAAGRLVRRASTWPSGIAGRGAVHALDVGPGPTFKSAKIRKEAALKDGLSLGGNAQGGHTTTSRRL